LRCFKIEKFSFEEKYKDHKNFSQLIQFILKYPNYFDKYFDNDNIKKLCMNNYYLFILLYFYHYDKDYILELICPSKKIKINDKEVLKKIEIRAKEIKDLLKSNLKYFPNLPEKINMVINQETISNISNIDDLLKLLNKKMKLEDKLKIIIEKIKNIKTYKTINIKLSNTEISKDDNIDRIIKSFESLIQLGKQKNIFLIDLDPEIWKKYLMLYIQDKNIDNIYKIKHCVFQARYDLYLRQTIDTEILKLGTKMINEKLLKNEGVIKFFNNYFINNTKTLNPYSLLFLANGIFINEATEEFFKQFQCSNFKQFFAHNYSKFIEKIILNINKFDEFIFVFQLFPQKNNFKIDKIIIYTIVNSL